MKHLVGNAANQEASNVAETVAPQKHHVYVSKLSLLDDLGSGVSLNDLRRYARNAGFSHAGFRIVDHDV
jgi:hypothetical protein